MNYVPDETARDALHFFRLSESKLAQRGALDEKSQITGQKVRRDIFQYIFESRDPDTGLGFTKEQLHADTNLLIAAGSDGVGVTLSASVFYLLHNPEILKKLTLEIRSSFPTIEEIRLPTLNTLPYLQAVWEETLRISPPVPSALPREVLRGGLDVDGLHIPEGIDVGVAAYAIHHNETYFPDPWTYLPERWLGGGEAVTAAKRAWCPFSVGHMNCIGKNVASLAYKLALARILYVYDIRAANGVLTGGGSAKLGQGRTRAGEYQMTDWFIGYPDGPMVQFKARTA
jgi:cytochrome P450